MIELEAISKFYPAEDGSRLTVLENLDLRVDRGEVICVLGSNGRGKTTLLRLCAALLQPSAGRVRRDSAEHSPLGIGYVDQHYRRALFPWLTVRGNIQLASWEPTRIDTALRRLGIADLASRPVHTLSGGQAQLATIARAIAMPGPIVADEPTSALDLNRAFAASMELRRVAQAESRECVISTHSPDIGLLTADRAVVFPSSITEPPRMFDVRLNGRDREQLGTDQFQRLRLSVMDVMFR